MAVAEGKAGERALARTLLTDSYNSVTFILSGKNTFLAEFFMLNGRGAG
jgi:hypothetical protein